MADPAPKSKPVWSEIDEFLKYKVLEGFRRRGLPVDAPYLERIDYEGGIICETGYAPYFLIVTDLCRFMTEKKIRFVVRGSGCGSCYVWGLGISHKWLDPIKYKLPFERFLNPERISMPDLDIDISDDRRHEVVAYTIAKYGRDRVSRIISFGSLGAKAAIKDVARGLDLPDYQTIAEKITCLIPAGKVTLDECLKSSELLREMEVNYPQLFKMAKAVEGYNRNTGIHAAGVVIAPEPMTKYMPLHFTGNPADRTPADWEPTTAWDMYDCENRGLLKMDYLGLKTLKVIDDTVACINFIKQYALKQKPDFDVDEIDRHDDKAWQLLAAGKLSGIFQVERTFVRNFAKRMNLMRKDPRSLAVLVAIIRPGMMDAGTTEMYLQRASGQDMATPLHPLLAETLKDTYGILCFQEDIMWAARDFAGFSMAKSDVLRKGIGKKIKSFIDKMYPEFEKGALAKGATKEEIAHVWSLIESHARYSFNNAHASAYGMILTYQTAYLKANWPLAYMTSLINSEAGVGNKEQGYNAKVAEYIEEARALGIKIRPPCVKKSGAMCRVEWFGENQKPLPDPTIRFGLFMVKKASESGVAWIMKHARHADSFKDFALRCFSTEEVAEKKAGVETGEKVWKCYSQVGKGDIEALIQAGAFDVFDTDREKLLAMTEPLLKFCAKYWEQTCKIKNGKKPRDLPEKVKAEIDSLTIEEHKIEHRGLEDRLQQERLYTGCYLSDSPFAPYAATIAQYETCDVEGVQNNDYGGHGTFAAIIRDYRAIIVKNGRSKGQEMAFLSLTGIKGDVEVVAFSNAWGAVKNTMDTAGNKIPDFIERGKVYLVDVAPDRNGQSATLIGMTRLSNTIYAKA